MLTGPWTISQTVTINANAYDILLRGTSIAGFIQPKNTLRNTRNTEKAIIFNANRYAAHTLFMSVIAELFKTNSEVDQVVIRSLVDPVIYFPNILSKLEIQLHSPMEVQRSHQTAPLHLKTNRIRVRD